jgi:hypothetical protein
MTLVCFGDEGGEEYQTIVVGIWIRGEEYHGNMEMKE